MLGDKLTVLQMNDSHAYLDIHQELFWDGDHAKYQLAGGYARIATIFNQIREENPKTLAFDCGDTIHGTYRGKNQRRKFNTNIELLEIRCHDCALGIRIWAHNFKKLTKKLNYPVLAINCYQESNNNF